MKAISAAFCKALYQAGVRSIFSIPGAQLLSLWDDAEKCGLEVLVPRSEDSGVWLAAGYSLPRNRPALLANTLGPGIINELPALLGVSHYPVRMLCLHISQPMEKLAHIDAVFQGIHTAPSTEPWFDVSLQIRTGADMESVFQEVARLFSSVEEGASLCVRLDMEFPLLFQVFAKSKLSEAFELRSIKKFFSCFFFFKGRQKKDSRNKIDALVSTHIFIGSPSWVKKMKKHKAFQGKHAQTLSSHPKVKDCLHTFLLALGFVLGGGEAAFVKTTASCFVYAYEHFLTAKDWNIPLAFFISKKGVSLLRQEGLFLENCFPGVELYYGKTIHSKLRAKAKGVWLEF